jgi:hypothetical protein
MMGGKKTHYAVQRLRLLVREDEDIVAKDCTELAPTLHLGEHTLPK